MAGLDIPASSADDDHPLNVGHRRSPAPGTSPAHRRTYGATGGYFDQPRRATPSASALSASALTAASALASTSASRTSLAPPTDARSPVTSPPSSPVGTATTALVPATAAGHLLTPRARRAGKVAPEELLGIGPSRRWGTAPGAGGGGGGSRRESMESRQGASASGGTEGRAEGQGREGEARRASRGSGSQRPRARDSLGLGGLGIVVDRDSHDREGDQDRTDDEHPPTHAHAWYLDSLGRDELALLDTRFDEMGDDEIRAYLAPWAGARGSGLGRGGGGGGSSGRGRGGREPTPDSDRTPHLEATVSPSPPRRPSRSTSHSPTPSPTPSPSHSPSPRPRPRSRSRSPSPLFPPSPPPQTRREHPLRVLSRAVRELREDLARLEGENAELRRAGSGLPGDEAGAGVGGAGGVGVAGVGGVESASRSLSASGNRSVGDEARRASAGEERREVDREQMSIHDHLADALSTSLTSPSHGIVLLEENRPKSPSPSTRSVLSARSGWSSHRPLSVRGTTAPTTPVTADRPRAVSDLSTTNTTSATSTPTPGVAIPSSTSSSSLALPANHGHGLGHTSHPSGSSLGSHAGSYNRRTWGSIWGWGKKPPQSQGHHHRPPSTASLAPSIASRELEDDEWRRGDGGSSPAFKAVVHATRILTPEHSSVLARPAHETIAALAHTLVSNARDSGMVSRDPPGRSRARSRATSVGSQATAGEARSPASTFAPAGTSASAFATATGSATGNAGTPNAQSATLTLSDQALAATVSMGRTLLKHGKAMALATGASGTGNTPGTPVEGLTPSAAGNGEQRRPTITLVRPPLSRARSTATGMGSLGIDGQSPSTPLAETPPPSVELSSIVPDESRPPTVLLSRQNLGSFFQSTRVRSGRLTTATRFSSDQPPLTDRYGFIYDIQHASMLKDASRAGTPAPISLTGHVPEDEVRRTAPASPLARSTPSPTPPETDANGSGTVSGTGSGSGTRGTDGGSSSGSGSGSAAGGSGTEGTPGRKRGATLLNLAPAPARAIAVKDELTVSVRGSSGAQASAPGASPLGGLDEEPVTPVEASAAKAAKAASAAASAAASRKTVSSLLDQLTDMHDRQQAARSAEWDTFLRRRRRARRGRAGEQDVGISGALAAVVALQGSSAKPAQDEYRAFLRLVRRGIPIQYRADVWAECSGARDLLVPGEYAEILAVHANDTSPVMAEIEKDVGRTFPGNVFFGGDGPGVAKLRRVLTAYSWLNPAVGYCQGMNMLAATLLLTHTDEEQAFWVLNAVIDRLLPPDYFAPSLLGSRADQLALADLVATHVPRVSTHLADLGVDLTTVTFGWFLSLFTDCLPVETLFRVWDVFFVEGHDVLFRVALAILKLNEAELTATDGVGDLFAVIAGMTSRLWGADKLIALQHGYKGVVKAKDVQALCERHAAALQAEIEGDSR